MGQDEFLQPFAFCSNTKDVNDWHHEQQNNEVTLVLICQLSFQYSPCPKSPLSQVSLTDLFQKKFFCGKEVLSFHKLTLQGNSLMKGSAVAKSTGIHTLCNLNNQMNYAVYKVSFRA